MRATNLKAYDVDACIAEIYDQTETLTDDVELLRALLSGRGPLRILEPFCGNGRILIPLAEDGHTIVGLDKSEPMLRSARGKLDLLPRPVRERVILEQMDILTVVWPGGFDLVILGANCLYELATAEEQEGCVCRAQSALRPDWHLYLDNDHMEGDLDPSWRKPGVEQGRFPTGVCADGTLVRGTRETVWCDAQTRQARFRRTVEITSPDGSVRRREWVEQKHPPSTSEMREWLEGNRFEIRALWGDRKRSAYTDQAERAVFWARLRVPAA